MGSLLVKEQLQQPAMLGLVAEAVVSSDDQVALIEPYLLLLKQNLPHHCSHTQGHIAYC